MHAVRLEITNFSPNALCETCFAKCTGLMFVIVIVIVIVSFFDFL